MLPDPTCATCAQGALLQAAGAWLPGVPFCPDHEVADAGGREVSARRGVVDVLLRRWQLRLTERLFGWALPLLFAVLLLVSALRAGRAYPRTVGAVCAAGVVWWAAHAHPGAALVAFAVVLQAGAAVGLVAPDWCRARALAWWRGAFVYRRRWSTVMRVAGLEHADPDGERHLPRLARVRCAGDVDVLHVRAPVGQRFPEWTEAAPMVAHLFGASDVRVHRGDNRRLTVELLRGRRGRSWNREGWDLASVE
jgi:hypothetical protein